MPSWDDVSLPAGLDTLTLNIVLEQSGSFVPGSLQNNARLIFFPPFSSFLFALVLLILEVESSVDSPHHEMGREGEGERTVRIEVPWLIRMLTYLHAFTDALLCARC